MIVGLIIRDSGLAKIALWLITMELPSVEDLLAGEYFMRQKTALAEETFIIIPIVTLISETTIAATEEGVEDTPRERAMNMADLIPTDDIIGDEAEILRPRAPQVLLVPALQILTLLLDHFRNMTICQIRNYTMPEKLFWTGLVTQSSRLPEKRYGTSRRISKPPRKLHPRSMIKM